MDYSSSLMAEAVKMGIGGLLLLGAVIWMAKLISSMRQEDRERNDRVADELRKTIEQNKEECAKREADNTQRIRQLEERSHGEMSQLLHRSVSALETTARVFEKITDEDSGVWRARQEQERERA